MVKGFVSHLGVRLITLRDILSPAHPPCFIDISAMLPCNMADMSLSRGRGRKARKGVRGQVLDSSRSLGMTGLRGCGVGEGWDATDWQCGVAPARPFDGAQGERPRPKEGITLTLALSHRRERGYGAQGDSSLDSSRGLGMAGLRGLWGGGGRDGLASAGLPPLDPSTVLRVSGPAPRRGSPSP